jgi:hypothetical protein
MTLLSAFIPAIAVDTGIILKLPEKSPKLPVNPGKQKTYPIFEGDADERTSDTSSP